jgi:hypothetical protein
MKLLTVYFSLSLCHLLSCLNALYNAQVSKTVSRRAVLG